jgi:stalled ribosome rescue protein Dom34
MDSVANAAQQGAVEALVIVASMLRSGDDASRVRWEDIVAQVEASRGSVIQASIDHDAGQQLVGLGGAIALLRWKVE